MSLIRRASLASTVVAVVAAVSLPSAAAAAPGAEGRVVAAHAAAALWGFAHPDGNGGTYVALAARDESASTLTGERSARRGVEPSIFEVRCDVAADELVITMLAAADERDGAFGVEPLLTGAHAEGRATLRGSRTTIPRCAEPDWAAGRTDDLGSHVVTMQAEWTATGAPLPFPGGGAAIDPDDPTRCALAGTEVLVSRSGTATGRLAGDLPLHVRPPVDLGGPADAAEVMAFAAGSWAFALTGDCVPGA